MLHPVSPNRRRPAAVLAQFGLAVLLAGGLVAGVLLPWIGGTGLIVRDSASVPSSLPPALTDTLPGNTVVLAADGSTLTEFYANDRHPVTSDRIAAVMKQALVDIEDSRFYEHKGVDVEGTVRALAANVAAGSVQEGGSTLTQQLVKQTLLQTATTAEERQAATAGSVGRKLREAQLARAVEKQFTKDEILTRYLNLVYFGHGAYGIQSAAQRYFGVDAADLTLPQAAMLAGLVQSPANDDPITHPQNAQTRRDQVLDRMRVLGHITGQQFADLSAQPVAVAPEPGSPQGCAEAVVGGFFCAYLLSYLTDTLGVPQSLLDAGGLTIRTTLRPDLQTSGDRAVLNTLPMGDPLAGVFTAVEPGTGHVLAMSVNRRYGCSQRDCESVVLNATAGAGSGSTYKVFTAAAALERGFHADYTLTTGDPYVSRVYKVNGGTAGAPYVVQNVGDYFPPTLTMARALVMSSNTYFVGLEDALGSVSGPVRTAEAMGMHFDRPNQTPAEDYLKWNLGSFTLGTNATSPLDLASAYSTLAAGGTRCEPTPVTAVLDEAGRPLARDDGTPYVNGDRCTPGAVPPAVANTLNQIMIGDTATSLGTATRAAIPGHEIAGKTGTIQDNKSATFVGQTPRYTASVMVFNPKVQQDVGGYGGDKPAAIFHDAMLPVLSHEPAVPFPPADPVLAGGAFSAGTGL
jgi:membrane peptidoglycan carboxypeptidase